MANTIESIYAGLHGQCTTIGSISLAGANAEKVATSHQFVHDLELWLGVLGKRKEAEILRTAACEYQFGLLALTLGLYRQSFKSVRLTLELGLQMVWLSAHEIELREWLENRKDTVWGVLVDIEQGIFSQRFARAFFPDMEPHVKQHCALAAQLYRECSECVHGQIPKQVPLPASLKFGQDSFDLWHEKAGIVSLLVNAALALRYMRELTPLDLAQLETMLLERLGYIPEVRVILGGPKGG